MPAASVFALSGRLAEPVVARTDWPPITLLHGTADPVMPPENTRSSDQWFRTAGAAPHLQLFDELGHGIDGRVLSTIRHIIKRSFEA